MIMQYELIEGRCLDINLGMNKKMDENDMRKRYEYEWKKIENGKKFLKYLVMNVNEILGNDFD